MKDTAKQELPHQASRRREAAEWFVSIHEAGEPDTEVLQAWWRWMEADEENRSAFEAVARAWHTVPPALGLAMPSAEEVAADEYDGSTTVSQWLARPRKIEHRSLKRGWIWPTAALATAAALIGVMFVPQALEQFSRRATLPANEFVTRVGENLEVALADGSRVSLGAKSRIVVSFTDEQRNVDLKAGEAFFTVQKDRERPFRVHALDRVITAVGTAFNVRAVQDQVTVTVTEGTVKVGDATRSLRTVTEPRIESGQQAVFTAAAPASAPLSVTAGPEGGERVRWRQGWLVYRNEQLRTVLADISRYADRELAVSDEAAAQLRFSGAVHTTNIDEWLSALPESFPIDVESSGERVVIHSR